MYIRFEYVYSSITHLPLRIRQKLSIECQYNAVALRVGLLVDVDLTVDHGHNTVSKLLMDDRFNCVSINKNTLVQPINNWVLRGHRSQSSVGPPVVTEFGEGKSGSYVENLSDPLQLILSKFGLAVEGSCTPDLILAYLLGDLVEGQSLPALCLEKDGIDSWKVGIGDIVSWDGNWKLRHSEVI